MKIILVGNGKVGYTLASYLSTEGHDVVIIDKNEAVLSDTSDTLDVMCVKGNGASIEILKEAGAESANLLIAATNSDELNMLCCFTAKQLGTKHTIARIRDPEYYGELSSFKEFIGLSRVINPEYTAAQEIANLVQFPSANNIEFFVNGKVEMVEFRVLDTDTKIIGQKLSDLGMNLCQNMLICTMERESNVYVPNGSTVIEIGDKINIIGKREIMTGFFKNIGRYKKGSNTVMIVGGGRISYYLSELLVNSGIKAKIIEIDPQKCVKLSESLENTIIIQGDGTEKEVLDSENINETDAFIALTDRDEENLITAVYALQCGVSKVIAKSNRLSYNRVIEKLGIDSVISPKSITANHILRYVRAKENSQGSKIETMYKIIDGQAEAIEFIVNENSALINIPLKNLKFKENTLVAVIVKGNKIVIPHGNEFVSANDRVVIITKNGGFTDLDDILM